jgi:hypothetical protein
LAVQLVDKLAINHSKLWRLTGGLEPLHLFPSSSLLPTRLPLNLDSPLDHMIILMQTSEKLLPNPESSKGIKLGD